MLLDNLALFLRIVEKGGLAAAGREFGLSPATVSERLTALERHYGAALLTRTTRAISLTDEGRTLVDGARRLLAEADELESRVRLGVQTLSGPVRLSAPADLGRERVVPVVDAFLAEHPGVTVDLHLGDGYVDVVGQGPISRSVAGCSPTVRCAAVRSAARGAWCARRPRISRRTARRGIRTISPRTTAS